MVLAIKLGRPPLGVGEPPVSGIGLRLSESFSCGHRFHQSRGLDQPLVGSPKSSKGEGGDLLGILGVLAAGVRLMGYQLGQKQGYSVSNFSSLLWSASHRKPWPS